MKEANKTAKGENEVDGFINNICFSLIFGFVIKLGCWQGQLDPAKSTHSSRSEQEPQPDILPAPSVNGQSDSQLFCNTFPHPAQNSIQRKARDHFYRRRKKQ